MFCGDGSKVDQLGNKVVEEIYFFNNDSKSLKYLPDKIISSQWVDGSKNVFISFNRQEVRLSEKVTGTLRVRYVTKEEEDSLDPQMELELFICKNEYEMRGIKTQSGCSVSINSKMYLGEEDEEGNCIPKGDPIVDVEVGLRRPVRVKVGSGTGEKTEVITYYGQGYGADGISYMVGIESDELIDDSVQYNEYNDSFPVEYLLSSSGDGLAPESMFFCSLCDETYVKSVNNSMDLFSSFQRDLLDSHNQVRLEANVGEVILDTELCNLAQWMADDEVFRRSRNINVYPHTDSYGRSLEERGIAFGVEGTLGENIGGGFETVGYKGNIVQQAIQSWSLSPHHYDNMTHPSYTAMGFGMATYLRQIEGYVDTTYYVFVMVASDTVRVASSSSLAGNIPLTMAHFEASALAKLADCSSACTQAMEWRQLVKEDIEILSQGDLTPLIDKMFPSEKKVDDQGNETDEDNDIELTDKIAFFIPIMQTCYFHGVDLKKAESINDVGVLKELGSVRFSGEGEISADGGLEFIWGENEYAVIVVDLSFHDIIPGTRIEARAVLHGVDNACSDPVIGVTYFETRCFTSAEVISICIVDSDGSIIEESIDWNYRYEGDVRLRYKVDFKGQEYILKTSDFEKHVAGDRVLIWKNGMSQFQDKSNSMDARSGSYIPGVVPGLNSTAGAVNQIRGCRKLIQKGQEHMDIQAISSDNVAQNLNVEEDVIVPFTFYN